MTHHRCTTPAAVLAAIKYHQICLALVMAVAWLACDACAMPTMGGMNTRVGLPHYATRQQADMQQILLNELLNSVNEDTPLYNELKKYQRQQPNYLNKWPALRDLLPMADYGEDISDSGGADDSYEAANMRFGEHTRQLDINTVDGIDDESAGAVDKHRFMPPATPLRKKPQSAAAALKDHGIKKNIQYMSPCHFKICNMGRKRNARFFED